ncbi:MAG: 23S rRNA (pseudouridine(1915)-N(3))-methyltransferase RlmH [Clostridia bacterium]|nr:23S rRNA (pseudouridine(1915)-N(3))-methyltransferase RlmH [Clostridia bacterium]
MKIRVVAVGKVKEKYFREAIEEYSVRLSRFCEFSVSEVKEENYDKPTPALVKKIIADEGERIKKAIKGYTVVFSPEGKKYSSEGFADRIKKLTDEGVGEISFVIGGSYGIDGEVKRAAKESVSFSDMTFPHTLARVMALEQLYRAFMIITGSVYNK